MPRVGGNGPFRRGPVLSNNSSDDEAGDGGTRPGAPQAGAGAWKGSGDQSDQASNALFEQYIRAGSELGDDLGKDQVFQQGLSRIRDHLTSVDSSCCLICLNHVRPTEATWQCDRGCYTVLHLVCIQEWARSQVDAAKAKAAVRLSQFPAAAKQAGATAEWGCPKCRSTYPAAGIPRQYKCFCGKVDNPEFDPWITPHSCGEVCGRALSGECGHSCLLLCHPGPCPPCPLVVDAVCYCGRKRLKRRCGHHEFACEDVCGAKLDCGHRCPDLCHPGDCAPCRVMGDFPCRCGAERRRLPCAERGYQCDRVCGKSLACGNHNCDKVCHSGPCGECPFSGQRTCPCGKVSYGAMSCTDKAPSCGGTCGKLLPCGVHRCNDRCHQGECTTQCRGPALKTCRCGKSQKEVLCFQEFTCERRCNEMRACGRHQCKRRCCDGNCPPCEEVCGRRLKCGNHKCPAPCHSGPCRPCPLTVSVSCACGATTVTLPCGAESKAEPPHCSRPCAVPRICRHAPSLPPHRCHFGPCPPCPMPCGTPLACGHGCSESGCHDPAPPPVPDFQPPPPPPKNQPPAIAAAVAAGGAASAAGGGVERAKRSGSAATPAVVESPAQAPARAALETLARLAASRELPSNCPACRQPVMVGCVGGHGQRALPCCEQRPYSCGAACGRPLKCGNHTCALPCHAVSSGPAAGMVAGADGGLAGSSVPDAQLARPCKQCERRCERARKCSHPCPLGCHPGPCPRCEVQSRVPCMCGKSTMQLACYQLGTSGGAAPSKETASLLSCGKPCHRQLPYCPHPCKALCHAGPCPDPESCSVEVSVRCACPAKRRAKWKCSEVQAALVKAGKPRTYDDANAPRLLPCDKDCQAKATAVAAAASKAPAKAANGAAPEAAEMVASSMESLSDAPSGAAGAPEGKAGKVRLTRAEREALAMKKEAERKRQERLVAVFRGLILLVVVLVGVALAWGAKMFLTRLDRQLQERYAPKL